MAEAIQPVPPCAPSGPPAGGSDALVGRTLGDFVVVRKLGQGGMGQVFLADQVSLKRRVALKFLRPEHLANKNSLKRFQAEAEAVARVTHANIVQVYAIGEADGLHYMALEYVEGRTLREYLDKKTWLVMVDSGIWRTADGGAIWRCGRGRRQPSTRWAVGWRASPRRGGQRACGVALSGRGCYRRRQVTPAYNTL